MRKRRPEGVESMWAMARWHNGRLRVRRGLPPGALVWLCRIGLHFMTRDLLGDRYACRCCKQQLWNEHLWHGPQAERTAPVNDWANLYRQTPEVPVRATYIGNFDEIRAIVKKRWETGAYGSAHFRMPQEVIDRMPPARPADPPRLPAPLAGLLSIPIVVDDTLPDGQWQLVDTHTNEILFVGSISDPPPK